MKFFDRNFYSRLFSSNKFTVPFSLLLAFVIWLGITLSQRPTMERTFTNVAVNINLENTYVAENEMSIVGDISNQKFTVVVRGPNYVVGSLTSNDFNLYASAAEVDSPGNYSLQVNATRNNNSQYEILSISPPALDVNFDYMETKDFTITALAEGAAAAEGLIVEAGMVGGTESDTITISGPRTTINSIDKVVAVASVNKTLESSETFDASIVLFDDQGKKINQKDLVLSTTDVKVTVPISKKKAGTSPAFLHQFSICRTCSTIIVKLLLSVARMRLIKLQAFYFHLLISQVFLLNLQPLRYLQNCLTV